MPRRRIRPCRVTAQHPRRRPRNFDRSLRGSEPFLGRGCVDWPAACVATHADHRSFGTSRRHLIGFNRGTIVMTMATLTISSKNYSSWSLRGWLLCRMAGLEFAEEVVPVEDPANRAELLLLSPSILVPCLVHDGMRIWDTLAIAEYLNEIKPEAGLLPASRAARARCRSICGEMHSGFANLRSALPMNL